MNPHQHRKFTGSLRHYLLSLFALATLTIKAQTVPKISTDVPIEFFTNVASRFLASEGEPALTHIQVYPANQYTPSVHRLLQLTANLYDATTTNFYPAIFRPYFSAEGTNIYISGYEQVDGTNLSALTTPVDLADAANSGLISNDTRINIYGIPWILGAKKGLPNFNEVAMDSVFEITRKIQITRPLTYSSITNYHANQMLVLAVSNLLAAELWNSYETNYPGGIHVQADGILAIALSNETGFSFATKIPVSGTATLESNVWAGRGSGYLPPNPQSFLVPLFANLTFLTPSAYGESPPTLIPLSNNPAFGPPDSFPVPRWVLTTTNHLRCVVFDTGPPWRVIDYVQLDGPSSIRQLSLEIQTPDNAVGVSGLWSTNLVKLFSGLVPLGVANQINIAMGSYPSTESDWKNNVVGYLPGSKDDVISTFQDFILAYSVTTNTMLCPFVPTRRMQQLISWQANDPLVHYESSDLNWPPGTELLNIVPLASAGVSNRIGYLNERYQPWGGSPLRGSSGDPNAFNVAVKDPNVRSSDDWNFPTNESLNPDWIGRVHRGTPWQTVYLKSAVASLNQWTNWSGGANNSEALRSHPTNDWHLAALWASLLNTNPLFSLFSVNNQNLDAWRARLDALTALTNSPTGLDAIIISSNSPQSAAVANAIESARIATGGFFGDTADLLSVPELSMASPWLNFGSGQSLPGITDEACEILPSQLLPLLRADSIGKIRQANGNAVVQFTGYEEHSYTIQISSNLLDWSTIATNWPTSGFFYLTNSPASNQQFYRSVLLE